MNRDRLKQSLFMRMKLRPTARSIMCGRALTQRDDEWIVTATKPNGVIELSNIVTGHVAKLGADHIHHFDSDPMSEVGSIKRGIFTLTVQIFMSGGRLWIEPLPLYQRRHLTRRPTT